MEPEAKAQALAEGGGPSEEGAAANSRPMPAYHQGTTRLHSEAKRCTPRDYEAAKRREAVAAEERKARERADKVGYQLMMEEEAKPKGVEAGKGKSKGKGKAKGKRKAAGGSGDGGGVSGGGASDGGGGDGDGDGDGGGGGAALSEAKAAILRQAFDLEGGPEKVAKEAAELLGHATAGKGTDAIIDWCLLTMGMRVDADAGAGAGAGVGTGGDGGGAAPSDAAVAHFSSQVTQALTQRTHYYDAGLKGSPALIYYHQPHACFVLQVSRTLSLTLTPTPTPTPTPSYPYL